MGEDEELWKPQAERKPKPKEIHRTITKELFARADQDGDKFLNRSEVEAAMAGGNAAEQGLAKTDLFSSMDLSGDGRVSRSELLEWTVAVHDGTAAGKTPRKGKKPKKVKMPPPRGKRALEAGEQSINFADLPGKAEL